MTEEKWMHLVFFRSLYPNQKPASYPPGKTIKYFVGDQYTETVILNSGFTISHYLSDFFQVYQDILEKLTSVHFSFQYKYMPNVFSFEEEKSLGQCKKSKIQLT